MAMATAEWTWIIYLAGDNDLESAAVDDLKEMKRVGSSDRLHVIAQFDTEKKGTTRYRVGKGKLEKLLHMPGVNAGDSKVLSEFISWSIERYPATHYLVDIWNHGGGWENLPPDYDYEAKRRSGKPMRAAKLRRMKRSIFKSTAEEVLRRDGGGGPPGGKRMDGVNRRAIAIDTGSHDYLDNQELKRAMANGLGPMRKADILGCDACLMQMLEIAYEMRTTASYMVGSEQTEPGAGWPYKEILTKLAAKPAMAPVELAKLIATEYGAWYTAHGDSLDGSATQSTLDLTKIDGVVHQVNDLARALMKELPAVGPAISFALSGTQNFEDSPEYIDVRSFATQLEKKLPADSKARLPVSVLLRSLAQPSTFVLANTTWGKAVDRASGVSIYFPKPEEYSPDYPALELSKNGKWREFLETYNHSVQ